MLRMLGQVACDVNWRAPELSGLFCIDRKSIEAIINTFKHGRRSSSSRGR